MSNFEKDNIENKDNEEFQNKKISNNLPDIDDEMLKTINNKGKTIRNLDDEDLEIEESNSQVQKESNSKDIEINSDDIINSLINYSDNQKVNSLKPKETETIGFFSKLVKKIIKEKSDRKNNKDNIIVSTDNTIKKIKPKKDKKSNLHFFTFKKKKEQLINSSKMPEPITKLSDELSTKTLPIENILVNSDNPVLENEIQNITEVSKNVGDELDEEIEINTIDDIEKDIKSTKSSDSKINKKLLIIIGVVFSVLLIFSILIITIVGLFSKKSPVTTSKIPTETIEVGKVDVTSNINALIEKQGYIKRILGDKIVIVPDDELEDVIYYVKDINLAKDIVAGAHIQYGYTLQNYIPQISEISEIKTGKIVYKGIMTVNVMVKDESLKFLYSKELESTMKGILTGDEISYVSKEIDKIQTITSVIKINGTTNSGSDATYKVDAAKNPATNNLYSGYIFNKNDFYNEYLTVNNRPTETRNITKTNVENNTIKFYSGLKAPIWIRFAWRITDIIQSVPNVENIDLILETPSGIKINHDNIDTYGRMWIDGDIVNYALKTPEIGEYKIVNNKPKGTFLGEAKIFVMGLSGFITIDKFGANLIDRDNLELIWNIGGVPDDGLEIEVYLTNDRFSTMVYSSSSKKEILHIVDKKTVSVANLPKGKYNILVKVKDLDLKTTVNSPTIAENTIVVSAETITDSKNMGILILQ